MRSTALNVKSEYSAGSLIRIEALLDRVRELKMDTAGLADRATLLGIPHLLSAARRRGLRVLIGVELPILSSVPEEAAAGITFPLIVRVAAADAAGASAGLRALHRLVGRSEPLTLDAVEREIAELRMGAAGVPVTAAPILSSSSSSSFELIAQSPGQTGEVSVRILRGQMDLAERLALRLTEVFGRSCLYLGVSIHGVSIHGVSIHGVSGGGVSGGGASSGGVSSGGVSSGGVSSGGASNGRASSGGAAPRPSGVPEGGVWNGDARRVAPGGRRPTSLEVRLARETVEFAARLGLTVAASNEVDHLTPDEATARVHYEAICARTMGSQTCGHDANGTNPTLRRALPNGVPTDLPSPDALEALFAECPEALEGLEALEARCRLDPRIQALSPLEALLDAPGIMECPGAVCPGDAAARAADRLERWLEPRARRAASRRSGVLPRFREEMAVIRRHALAAPLLLLSRIFPEEAEDTALRSSAIALPEEFLSGSWVAHALGLTPVDPVTHVLPLRFPAAWLQGREAFEIPLRVAPGQDGHLDRNLIRRFGAESVAIPVRVERHDAASALLESSLSVAALQEAAVQEAGGPGVVSPALVERTLRAVRALSEAERLRPDAILTVFQNDPHLARAYHRDEHLRTWFDTARRIVGLPRCFTADTGARFLAARAIAHLGTPQDTPGGGPLRRSVVDARPVARLTLAQSGFEPLLAFRLEAHHASPPVGAGHPGGDSPAGEAGATGGALSLLQSFQPAARPRARSVASGPASRVRSRSSATSLLREEGSMVLSVVAGPTPVPPVGSAAGVLRRPAGATRAHGGRFSPLAVIERAEPARVPTLRDATMAVALNRLRPRRPALVALYLRRRAAAEPVDCGDAALTRILMSTQGLLIYDEQVVDMAVRLAGFSALEAEEFRIALASAGDDPDESAERATWRVRFIRGAVARGHAIARAEATFAALRQAAVGTVSRGACVVEAMRLLRDAYGFGAVRDGRAPGNPFVATREAEAQLSFTWLEDGPGESATVQTSPAASREALIDEPCELRRRA